MAKGIIYLMKTVVPGLVKIGKTDNYKERMKELERNGYYNVTGLKRKFAIEVEDYDEKEKLLHALFSKARVAESELFALDVDLAMQLLSSFEGRQIYPENQTKEQVFDTATEAIEERAIVPNGLYWMNRKVKGVGVIKAKLEVKDGVFRVLKGSDCCAKGHGRKTPAILNDVLIENDVLQQDVVVSSLSAAAEVVLGGSVNGWEVWKTEQGVVLKKVRDNN
ncbi:DUF4357 domain-containing protein [Olsenella sp. KGMB02461]|nr:DUF4357 domain-containing protein [Olsenella sp. KGMB02461]